MKQMNLKSAAAAVLLTGLFAGGAFGQTTQPVTVPRSEQFEITNAAGKPYRISIAQPTGKQPDAGFAVLYVLDANGFYATAVEATRFQQGNVPCVVVGIGYPQEKLDMARRYWDFTPWTSQEHIAIRKLNRGTEGFVEPSGTGGEEEFFQFLQTVVKPQVENRFKIDPAKQVLFGHSLSARFVLHTLAKHPTAFSFYCAASPSIWWDGSSVVGEIESYLKSNEPKPAGVLITVGEYEQKPSPGTSPDRAAFFAAAKMVDNARAMGERLTAGGVNATFIEYSDENHGTVVPLALSRAIYLALKPPNSSSPGRTNMR